ncbi:MAG: hypothetical protein SGILL_005548 [Bacillariaceae sp.]
MKFSAAFFAIAAASQAAAFAPSMQQRSSSALNGVLSQETGKSALDPSVIARYDALPFPSDTILAEYVWVDAEGNTRSKTRTLPAAKAESVESLPKWNFDGSSTGQAPGDDSEVILRPCRIFKDPFRPRSDELDNILVMCDTWTPAGEALPTNSRAVAEKSFAGKDDEETWFGLEQEFTLFNLDERTPLGWPEGGMPSRPQGPYYCSVGPENNFGRAITDAMYRACLYSGIAISGVNGEVMPGQQEYQGAVCEDFQVYCTLHPKPIVDGDWNGMHTNVSTKSMREEGGLEVIKQAIYKLGEKHAEHIAIYGEGNELRLTGLHETASIENFSYGIANRGASVRIGRDTLDEGKGYFEDRRPSSNADPYLVTGKIMSTIMGPEAKEIAPLNKDEA